GYRFIVKQRSGLRISQLQVQRISSTDQVSVEHAEEDEVIEDAASEDAVTEDANERPAGDNTPEPGSVDRDEVVKAGKKPEKKRPGDEDDKEEAMPEVESDRPGDGQKQQGDK
ncbi:MAG: hypothetical protein WBM59_00980, partial [Sedimenticolaceae bacterium]